MNSKKILTALATRYQSEIQSSLANIDVYMGNPAGIGEHPDIAGAVDEEIVKLSEAIEKYQTVKSFSEGELDYLFNDTL